MENINAVATVSLIVLALAAFVVGAVVAARHATGRRLEEDLETAGLQGIGIISRSNPPYGRDRSVAA